MNSKQVQWCLSNYYDSPVGLRKAEFIVPNINFGWGEADYFFVSKSGYGTEVEIKVSIQDLRADFGKYKWQQARPNNRDAVMKRFYYAVPEEIAGRALAVIENCEIPQVKEAGLLVVSIENHRPHVIESRPSGVNKLAKKLNDTQKLAYYRTAHFRYWTLFDNFIESRVDKPISSQI